MHCMLTGLSFQLSVMARERGSRLIPCSCELRGGSARGERPTRKAAGGFWGIGIMSPISPHVPEMKPEQKQEQAVTPQREIAPKQEQGEDFGLGL